MPSFDVVSEVEMQEVTNGVDQSNREVSTRFDFKGTNASFELNESVITMKAEAEFQLQQMLDILQTKLNRRGIDIACLELGDTQQSGKEVRQEVTIRQGLDSVLSKKIVKLIKDKKLKVQVPFRVKKCGLPARNAMTCSK